MARDRIKEHAKNLLWSKSHLCAGCAKPIESIEEATLDHIIPRSMGGHTRLMNLQLMHMKCNSRKGSQLAYFSTDMMRAFEVIPSRQQNATPKS